MIFEVHSNPKCSVILFYTSITMGDGVEGDLGTTVGGLVVVRSGREIPVGLRQENSIKLSD